MDHKRSHFPIFISNLSRWLERVLASGKMGGEDQDDQEGELMSEQEVDLDLEADRQEEEITKHWAVKAATSIALLFKVGTGRREGD